MTVEEGLRLAESEDLDLVEVAPKADPPVCRIMDYGKYKYEQNKRARQSRKGQHAIQVKEIRMRPKIDDHDYRFKLEHVKRFLGEGHKVKLLVTFRGREMAHTEFGRRLLTRVVEETQEVAKVELTPKMEGRSLVLILSPGVSSS